MVKLCIKDWPAIFPLQSKISNRIFDFSIKSAGHFFPINIEIFKSASIAITFRKIKVCTIDRGVLGSCQTFVTAFSRKQSTASRQVYVVIVWFFLKLEVLDGLYQRNIS